MGDRLYCFYLNNRKDATDFDFVVVVIIPVIEFIVFIR